MKNWILRTIMAMLVFGCVYSAGYADDADSLLTTAILDFEPKNVDVDVADFVTEQMNIALFKSGKFRVVERSQLKRIMSEHQLKLSGLTGDKYVLKLGELLSAKRLLIGTVRKLGTEFLVTAKIINTETAEMEAADSIQITGLSAIPGGCSELIKKMLELDSTKVVDKKDSAFSIESTVNYVKQKFKVNDFDAIKNTANNVVGQIDEGIKSITYTDTGKKTVEKKEIKKTENKGGLPFLMRLGPIVKPGLNFTDLMSLGIYAQDLAIGGRATFRVAPHFWMGLEGYAPIYMDLNNSGYVLQSGYGGITFAFSFRLFNFIRLEFNSLVGIGGYEIIDTSITASNIALEDSGIYTNLPSDRLSSGVFFVVEPGFLMAFEVTSFLELGVQGGVLFTTPVYEPGFDLGNVYVGGYIAFKVGKE